MAEKPSQPPQTDTPNPNLDPSTSQVAGTHQVPATQTAPARQLAQLFDDGIRTPNFTDDEDQHVFQSPRVLSTTASSTQQTPVSTPGTHSAARAKIKSAKKRAKKERKEGTSGKARSKKSHASTDEPEIVPVYSLNRRPLVPPPALIHAHVCDKTRNFLVQLAQAEITTEVEFKYVSVSREQQRSIFGFLDHRIMIHLANQNKLRMVTSPTGTVRYEPRDLAAMDEACLEVLDPALAALDVSDFWRKRPYVPFQHALPVVELDPEFVFPYTNGHQPRPTLQDWQTFEYAHSNILYNGIHYAANCRHPVTRWDEHPWCTACLVNFKIPLCGYSADGKTKVPNTCYICARMGPAAIAAREKSYLARLEQIATEDVRFIKIAKKPLPPAIRDQFFADVSDLPNRGTVKANPEWKKKGIGFCRPASLVPYYWTAAEYFCANLSGTKLANIVTKHFTTAVEQYQRYRSLQAEADEQVYPDLPPPKKKASTKKKEKDEKDSEVREPTPEFERPNPVLDVRTRGSTKRDISDVVPDSSDDDILTDYDAADTNEEDVTHDDVISDSSPRTELERYQPPVSTASMTVLGASKRPEQMQPEQPQVLGTDAQFAAGASTSTQQPVLMELDLSQETLNRLSNTDLSKFDRVWQDPAQVPHQQQQVPGISSFLSQAPVGSTLANVPPSSYQYNPGSSTTHADTKLTFGALFDARFSAAPGTLQVPDPQSFSGTFVDTAPGCVATSANPVPVTLVQNTAQSQVPQTMTSQTQARAGSTDSQDYHQTLVYPTQQSYQHPIVSSAMTSTPTPPLEPSRVPAWHSTRDLATIPVPTLQHNFDYATPVRIAGEAAGIVTETVNPRPYLLDDLKSDPYQEAGRTFVPRSNLACRLNDRLRSWYSPVPAAIGKCVILDLAGFVVSDINVSPPTAVPDQNGNFPTDHDEVLVTQAELLRQDTCARGLIKMQESDELMHLGLRNLTLNKVPTPTNKTFEQYQQEVQEWSEKIGRLTNALRHTYTQREELVLDTAAITCAQRRRDNSVRTHGQIKVTDVAGPITTGRNTVIQDPRERFAPKESPSTSVAPSPARISRDPRLSLNKRGRRQ